MLLPTPACSQSVLVIVHELLGMIWRQHGMMPSKGEADEEEEEEEDVDEMDAEDGSPGCLSCALRIWIVLSTWQ